MAAARVNQVRVASADQLESTVSQYIAQGFVTMNRTPTRVTMFKKKEFNILWAVIGFFLCILPLLIYAVVYATQSDQMVEISISEDAVAVDGSSQVVQISPDGNYWWDGTRWQLVSQSHPPTAVLSADGTSWYDGKDWHSLKASDSVVGPAPEVAPEAADGDAEASTSSPEKEPDL